MKKRYGASNKDFLLVGKEVHLDSQSEEVRGAIRSRFRIVALDHSRVEKRTRGKKTSVCPYDRWMKALLRFKISWRFAWIAVRKGMLDLSCLHHSVFRGEFERHEKKLTNTSNQSFIFPR